MNWYLKVLKQYADFNGRARRKEYWMFVLISTIISSIIIIISSILSAIFLTADSPYYLGINILSSIYSLSVFIPSLAVGVRRLHDVGKSGWLLLLNLLSIFFLAIFTLLFLITILESSGSPLILETLESFESPLILEIFEAIKNPLILYGGMAIFSLLSFGGAIWLIVLLVKDGEPGENKYGENPKELEAS
jgi:uncharacterized membrane protein YhaH (DUF805 family)